MAPRPRNPRYHHTYRELDGRQYSTMGEPVVEDLHDPTVADFVNGPPVDCSMRGDWSEPAGGAAGADAVVGRSAVRPPGFLVSVSRDSRVRLPGV